MNKIRGLSAFPVTPATVDGRVDTDALQLLLKRSVDAGADSIGLLGSTGSYPYFTREERRRAIAAASECVGDRVPLLVGIGSLRTGDVVELARDAKLAGASAGLLAPVSYAPLRDEEVFGLFEAVAEVGLPLCIYNNPGTTHFTFSPELVARIAVLHGVVAVKNPAPGPGEVARAVLDLRARVPAEFSIGFSVDWHAVDALLAGGEAWYSVFGGICPRICVELTRAAQAGDAAKAREINGRLQPVWDLFRTHSSYRVVHLMAQLSGIANAVPPRPVKPLSGEAAREVERVFGDIDLG